MFYSIEDNRTKKNNCLCLKPYQGNQLADPASNNVEWDKVGNNAPPGAPIHSLEA